MVSVAVTQSDISLVELSSWWNVKTLVIVKENNLVLLTSGFEFCSTSNFDTAIEGNANNVVDANFTVSNSETVEDKNLKSVSSLDASDLPCNEQLSLEEVVPDDTSSHQTMFSELQSIFPKISNLDFSNYTLLYDSGSQFFDQKSTYDCPTSSTFSLFLDFKRQFSRSKSPIDPKFASRAEDERQLYSTVISISNFFLFCWKNLMI